jgi:formylglycine-generating enzyme required for sulfatase activity
MIRSMRVSNLWIVLLLAALPIASRHSAFAGPDQNEIRRFRDCSDCPEMVVIPPGNFLMGSSKVDTTRDLESAAPDKRPALEGYSAVERPQHAVSIERPFALGRSPTTRGEFATFVRETGYSTDGGCTLWNNHAYLHEPKASWENPGFPQTDRDPVVCVSWQDAKAYIAWLNSKSLGRAPAEADSVYRLPSEAEWEYAARAGTRTARWWGDAIGSDNADCDGCGSRWDKQRTAPVGSFNANPFGLSDMLGDAWQWTEDCWNLTYEGAPHDGGAWTSGRCDSRVMRGGSWTNDPWILRSAHRTKEAIDGRYNYRGFRVAKTIGERRQ